MDNLTAQLNSILTRYTDNIDELFDQIMKEAAEEAVEMLKDNSPVRSGKYAKGWAIKKMQGRYIIHNKTGYQLTHLLENGHDVVVNGRKVGHKDPQTHIKPVEEWVQDELPERLKERLSK